MKQTIMQINGKMFLVIIALLSRDYALSQQQVDSYNNSVFKDGYSIVRQDENGININFSVNRFSTVEKNIQGQTLQNISIPGMFLPNEAGYPDLPGNARYIAIPQGSKAVLN